ncbi:MAG: hypothetical protein RhofKO_41750 [Rhodothermales bacterium]
MDNDRWQRLQALYFEAAEKPAEQHEAFLHQACGDDPELFEEVRSLLAAEATPSLLDASVEALSTLMPAPDTPQMPTAIGPYRVMQQLGRGGMGTVHLAVREDVGKQVAIKFVRDGLASPERRQRFLYERRLLARLTHPNIAPLLDAGVTEQGVPYLVMDYVEGQPLDVYCEINALSLDQRLALFSTICQAVAHAHHTLIVHRDLKPSNILVTPEGQPMLLDFGIAKLLEEDEEAAWSTQAGQRLMSPGYASPEQVRGEAITTASDVYSLGVILYELLTGQSPYDQEGRTTYEIEQLVLTQEPKRPTAVGHRGANGLALGSAHHDLDAICLKALRKEPAHRYASAAHVHEDLERYEAGFPVLAQHDTLSYRVRKFVERHKVGVVATLLIACSLVGGLGAALWQGRIAAKERNTAQLEAKRARAVKDFLVQSFQAASPDANRSDTLTVVEWLDAGLPSLHDGFADQPVLYAELLGTVGDVYRSLGQFDQAEPLLVQAHQVARETAPVGTRLRATTDYLLGRFRFEKDLFREADSMLHSSVVQFEQLGDWAQAAQAREQYGIARYRQDDNQAALMLQQQNLAYYRSLDPVPLVRVAAILDRISTIHRSESNIVEAIRFQRQALDIRGDLDDGGKALSSSLYNLAMLLIYETEHPDQAEPLLREMVTIDERIYPPGHYRAVLGLFPLGDLLGKQGEFEEAEALMRKGMANRRAQYPEGHFMVAEGLLYLGNLLKAQSRFEEARAAYKESYENYRVSRGESYRGTVIVREGLIATLDSLGRHAEADRYRTVAH